MPVPSPAPLPHPCVADAPVPLTAWLRQRSRARRAPRALLPPRPAMALPSSPPQAQGATAAQLRRRGSRPFHKATAKCEAAAPPLTAAAPGPSSGGGEASFRRGPRSNGGAGDEERLCLRGVTLGGRSAWAVTQPPPG